MKELLMEGEIINGKELTKYFPFPSFNHYHKALCQMSHSQHKEAMALKEKRKSNSWLRCMSEDADETLRRNELVTLYRRGEQYEKPRIMRPRNRISTRIVYRYVAEQ